MRVSRSISMAGLLVLLAGQVAVAEYVAADAKSWDGKPAVGDGECVALVKEAAKIPGTTSDWKAGKAVKDATLKEGTAIATFVDGKYSGHAALYLGQNKDGIQVIDQWAERKDKDGKVTRPAQPPHKRTIKWNGSPPSDKGTLFHVIEKK